MKGDLIDALPKSLKIIVSCTAGFDSYDGPALAKRGIVLCNSPGLAAGPVADQVLYVTLSLFRYFQIFERLARKHQHIITCRTALMYPEWDLETGQPKLHQTNKNDPTYDAEADVAPKFSFGEIVSGRFVRQPRGHVAGIIGFGAIGKEIGRRLDSIGMKIHYTKTRPLSEQEVASLGYPVTFHETADSLFPHCDVLVLACPLNAQTRYIVNEKSLALLPQEAKIINIGRGGLIDTKALLHSLKIGHISGAGLDVFEKEPIIDAELCDRWDIIITPHTGSSTVETVEKSEKNCIDNIYNSIFGDGKSLTRVN